MSNKKIIKMQKRTEKKMKITVINKHGDLPKTQTVSFLENSKIYQEIINLISIDIPFEKLKLEYIYDDSWGYKYEDHNVVVDFYKDDNGVNIVEQFLRKVKGKWQEIEPTKLQIEQMFKMLDAVEIRKNYD